MAALPLPPLPTATPAGASPRQRLLQQARQGLSLGDRPFDALGAPLGLDGDAVIDLLRQWLSQGRIAGVGLVWADGPLPAGDALDTALRAATASGLPLLRQPYEALGAMLGLTAQQVQCRLADWQRDGRLLRIAAVVPPADARPDADAA
jgi:hypothetical protein